MTDKYNTVIFWRFPPKREPSGYPLTRYATCWVHIAVAAAMELKRSAERMCLRCTGLVRHYLPGSKCICTMSYVYPESDIYLYPKYDIYSQYSPTYQCYVCPDHSNRSLDVPALFK